MIIKIFQIYYDDETLRQVWPEFTPYDNSNPLDPTWFEYSAIKQIIENNSFSDDDYLGVLSPKFTQKTGLNACDVIKITSESAADIISFSPHILQNTCFINGVLQGNRHHPGLLDITQKVADELGMSLNFKELFQDQTRIIFSNYFVAKFSFWKIWHSYSTKIYEIARNQNNWLSRSLNSYTEHYRIGDRYQFKVFVMERLVSMILEKLNKNAIVGLDFEKYVKANPQETNFVGWALILDSLKSQFLKTGRSEYINIWNSQVLQIKEIGAKI